jgi:hypothetical protein
VAGMNQPRGHRKFSSRWPLPDLASAGLIISRFRHFGLHPPFQLPPRPRTYCQANRG